MKPKAALTARLSEAKENVTKSAVAERSKALAAKCAIVKKRLTKLLGTRSSVVQVYGLLILPIKAAWPRLFLILHSIYEIADTKTNLSIDSSLETRCEGAGIELSTSQARADNVSHWTRSFLEFRAHLVATG